MDQDKREPSAGVDPHHFDFDLDQAIRDQVILKLKQSPTLPLARGVGPRSSGIYALYYKDALVYIGKASRGMTASKRDLRSRLNEHCAKIEGRQNILCDDMQCRFLVFDSEWWVVAAEYALMTHYSPEWNNSGFGSKVPGKGRPGTKRVSKWDRSFPLKP